MMNVQLTESQRLFITSDTHAFHKNLCKGISTWEAGRGQRDFSTLEDMNDAIVNKINNVVDVGDILIHLGDFAFGGEKKIREFRSRLNCNDIRLVLGNHDHIVRRNEKDLQKLFTKVCSVTEMRCDKQDFVLQHHPLLLWEGIGRGSFHLHGHTHRSPDKRFGPGKMMGVGVDGHGLKPYVIEEIIELLKNRPIASYINDYHITEESL